MNFPLRHFILYNSVYTFFLQIFSLISDFGKFPNLVECFEERDSNAEHQSFCRPDGEGLTSVEHSMIFLSIILLIFFTHLIHYLFFNEVLCRARLLCLDIYIYWYCLITVKFKCIIIIFVY